MISLMNTIADVYQDYNELMRDIDDATDDSANNVKKETIYESIMKKEENRINLLNRMMDKKQEEAGELGLFLNMSLSDIANKAVSIWWDIYMDVLYRKVTDPVELFWKGERKIFVGLLVVVIATVLFFVNISG